MPAFLTDLVRRVRARLRDSPLLARMARSVTWALIGSVLSRGTASLAMIIAARTLGTSGFGELAMVQSTNLLLSTLVGFGLGLSATKNVAQHRGTDPGRAGRVVALSEAIAVCAGALMAAALFGLSPLVAGGVLDSPEIERSLALGTGITLLGVINGTQLGILAGFEAFRSIAATGAIAGFASMPLVGAGAVVRGVDGAVVGLMASQFIGCCANHVAIRSAARRVDVPVRHGGCFQEWRMLLDFSLPAVLATIGVVGAEWGGRAILARHGGYAEVGIFQSAYQYVLLVSFVPMNMGRASVPLLAERLSSGDSRGVAAVTRWAVRGNLIAAVPLVALGAVASPWLMGLCGPGYAVWWPVLALLLGKALLLAVAKPFESLFTASGALWHVVGMVAVYCPAILVICYVLRGHGAGALAVANVIGFFVYLVMLQVLARYRGHVRVPARETPLP